MVFPSASRPMTPQPMSSVQVALSGQPAASEVNVRVASGGDVFSGQIGIY